MSKKKVKFEYQANQERDHMLWNKITSGRQNALFKRTAASKAQKIIDRNEATNTGCRKSELSNSRGVLLINDFLT